MYGYPQGMPSLMRVIGKQYGFTEGFFRPVRVFHKRRASAFG